MRLPSRARRRKLSDGRPPAPFVVGVSRSGTTLLRLMLDAHHQLAIPPETHFIPELVEACQQRGAGPDEIVELLSAHRRWPDFRLDTDELRGRLAALDPFGPGPALREFYGLYAERAGKPRWGDKTPHYTRKMRLIEGVLPAEVRALLLKTQATQQYAAAK